MNISLIEVSRQITHGLKANQKIMSVKFYESISIVTAILSNGAIFAFLSNETIDLIKI